MKHLRTTTLSMLAAGMTVLCPPRALAQSPTTPDSGRVVLSTVLGGDSSQASGVTLRARATYRVQVQPARADLQIRRRLTGPTPPPFLTQTPVPALDTLTHWRTFDITADSGGQHFVELTNPGVGSTLVRVTMLRPPPVDAAQAAVAEACRDNPRSAGCPDAPNRGLNARGPLVIGLLAPAVLLVTMIFH